MNKLSVIQNVKRVETDPFPFVAVEDALPDRIYEELVNTFPEEKICETSPLDGGICYRLKSKEVLSRNDLPNIWLDFFEYHTSREYFNECLKIFEGPIITSYGQKFFDNLTTSPIGIRGLSDTTELVTDCQFVVHEPITQNSTSRTPHLDNPIEIYAGLFYLKQINDLSSGGDLTIFSTDKDVNGVDKALGRQVDKKILIPAKTISYKPNSFCMFLNVHNSVHGVSPRIGAEVRRRSINIIGELNNGKHMWETKNKRTYISRAKDAFSRLIVSPNG